MITIKDESADGNRMKGKEIDDRESVCVAVVEMLRSETGTDVTEFMLYDTIDTDALEMLFSTEKPETDNIRLAFDVLDTRVIIERENGSVSVTLAD